MKVIHHGSTLRIVQGSVRRLPPQIIISQNPAKVLVYSLRAQASLLALVLHLRCQEPQDSCPWNRKCFAR